MPRPRNPVPTYRLNKATGQAFCSVAGKRYWLGVWGSPASKAAYRRLVAELAVARDTPAPVPIRGEVATVADLAARWLAEALTGYSQPETANYRAALSHLLAASADTPPAEFGPKALAEVRAAMIRAGWTRQHVNAQVRRVRAVFRWAESREMVPAGKWFQLRSLPGLKAGQGPREQRVVKPVADDVVEATLPHLSPTVAAMVRFHRLTGCRPQDVCSLHPDDIDRSAAVWVFRPGKHKGAHRGHTREVYIGPRAQQVIAPYLTGGFVFSPRRAWQERSDQRRAGAKRRKPGWTDRGPPANVGERFDTASYGRAVERACVRAGVEKWGPNRLRHAAGSEFREVLGLDAAQRLLGHRHARTTERYARPVDQSAVDGAAKLG